MSAVFDRHGLGEGFGLAVGEALERSQLHVSIFQSTVEWCNANSLLIQLLSILAVEEHSPLSSVFESGLMRAFSSLAVKATNSSCSRHDPLTLS